MVMRQDNRKINKLVSDSLKRLRTIKSTEFSADKTMDMEPTLENFELLKQRLTKSKRML